MSQEENLVAKRVEKKIMSDLQVKRLGLFSFFCVSTLCFILFLYKALALTFLLSIFSAYLLSPIINMLPFNNKKRLVFIFLLVLFFLSFLFLFLFWLFPYLYTEILFLVKKLPKVVDFAISNWLPWVKTNVEQLGLSEWVNLENVAFKAKSLSYISTKLYTALSTLWQTAPLFFIALFNLAMIPILTFVLLKDLDKIKSFATELVPLDIRSEVLKGAKRVDLVLKAVIKGQLTVAMILAVLYMVGFSLVSMQGALVIGLVAGLCRVIPYFDILVGGSLSLIVLLSDYHGWLPLISVAIVFLIVQTLDGLIITPRVIGSKVGLNPLVVILSVICFGDLFGFWGVLAAIPGVALMSLFWHEFAFPLYKFSKLYKRT